MGAPVPDIPSGGCVSATAFALACYLGFRKLILIGQDMAFTGGISHTAGIEGAFGDNDEYIKSRNRIQVEGIDGTMLETDFQMWYYKKWFEKAIRANEGLIEVIDATEEAHVSREPGFYDIERCRRGILQQTASVRGD